MVDNPFHTCPSCGEDGAQMLVLEAQRNWQDKEKFLCEHEDCTRKSHKAIYEIACKCGDEFFLCERHGEWEIVKAPKRWRRKKNKYAVTDFSMLARPSEGDNPAIVEDGNGVHEVRLKDLGVEK